MIVYRRSHHHSLPYEALLASRRKEKLTNGLPRPPKGLRTERDEYDHEEDDGSSEAFQREHPNRMAKEGGHQVGRRRA